MERFLGPNEHYKDDSWKPDPDDINDQKEREGYYPIPGLDPKMSEADLHYGHVI